MPVRFFLGVRENPTRHPSREGGNDEQKIRYPGTSFERWHRLARVAPVETRHVQNFDNCDCCHQVPGWATPSSPFFFAGRSPVQICRQFKNSDPDTFKNHVMKDPLVLAGFEGRRGQDLKPEPPPLPREAFQRVAPDWLALVGHGNGWKGGFDSD